MKLLKSVPFLLLLPAILLAVALATSVLADITANATLMVNTATDEDTDNLNCSLREAIIAANTNATYNGCSAGSGADTITFADNYTITLSSELPTITSPIIINGYGPANTIIQASTCNPVTLPLGCIPAEYRVLVVGNTGSLTLNGLTIRHGRCNGSCAIVGFSGGGVYNQAGTLIISNVTFNANYADFGGGMFNNNSNPTLANVTFSGNNATYYGGGMYNDSSDPTLTNTSFSDNSAADGGGMYNESSNPTLTGVTFSANFADYGGGMFNYNSNPILTNVIFSANPATNGGGMYNYRSSPALTNVTLSSNSATSSGAGIYNDGSSPALINVTFKDNSAGTGGGVYNNNSNPTLTNVTFSANSAGFTGGGMFNNNSSPTLVNVTFSNNSADFVGGGMYNDNSSLTLTNAIIANSTSGGDCVNNASTLNPPSSNNLIDDSVNACGLTDGTSGNIIGQDPILSALANNGGFTQTHALLASSPAINTGTNTSCPATDQRGAIRPQGAKCDIGSFEFGTAIQNLFLPFLLR